MGRCAGSRKELQGFGVTGREKSFLPLVGNRPVCSAPKADENVWNAYLSKEERVRKDPLEGRFHTDQLRSDVARLSRLSSPSSILSALDRRREVIDFQTVHLIVQSLCQKDRIAEALELIQALAKERGFKPTTHTFNTLTYFYCHKNMYEQAKKVLEYMQLQGGASDIHTYNILIQSLCFQGKPGAALQLFRDIEALKVDVNVDTYNILVESACFQQNLPQVDLLISEMTQKGIRIDQFTYNSLIALSCRSGKLKEARALLQQMRESNLYPNVSSFLPFIGAYCRKKDFSKSLEVFKEMQKTYGVAPNVECFNMMALFLSKDQQYQEVTNLLRQLHSKGIEPNVVTSNIALNASLSLGDVEDVLSVFNQILQPDSTSYTLLLLFLCRKQEVRLATKYWQRGSALEVRLPVQVYHSMIQLYLSVGYQASATSLLEEMKSRGFSIEQVPQPLRGSAYSRDQTTKEQPVKPKLTLEWSSIHTQANNDFTESRSEVLSESFFKGEPNEVYLHLSDLSTEDTFIALEILQFLIKEVQKMPLSSVSRMNSHFMKVIERPNVFTTFLALLCLQKEISKSKAKCKNMKQVIFNLSSQVTPEQWRIFVDALCRTNQPGIAAMLFSMNDMHPLHPHYLLFQSLSHPIFDSLVRLGQSESANRFSDFASLSFGITMKCSDPF